VPPVVTDVAGAGASPLRSVASSPVSALPALRAAPSSARVQNTAPHTKDDSTMVSEWITPDGLRTQLTFRVRGDTLRGTTSTIMGDRANDGPAFVAVRAICPG
jgi:hypothetical protein